MKIVERIKIEAWIDEWADENKPSNESVGNYASGVTPLVAACRWRHHFKARSDVIPRLGPMAGRWVMDALLVHRRQWKHLPLNKRVWWWCDLRVGSFGIIERFFQHVVDSIGICGLSMGIFGIIEGSLKDFWSPKWILLGYFGALWDLLGLLRDF